MRNGIPKRESKAGAISGILIGAIVLVLAALFGVFTLIKKRRALAQQKEGMIYQYIIQTSKLSTGLFFSSILKITCRTIQPGWTT